MDCFELYWGEWVVPDDIHNKYEGNAVIKKASRITIDSSELFSDRTESARIMVAKLSLIVCGLAAVASGCGAGQSDETATSASSEGSDGTDQSVGDVIVEVGCDTPAVVAVDSALANGCPVPELAEPTSEPSPSVTPIPEPATPTPEPTSAPTPESTSVFGDLVNDYIEDSKVDLVNDGVPRNEDGSIDREKLDSAGYFVIDGKFAIGAGCEIDTVIIPTAGNMIGQNLASVYCAETGEPAPNQSPETESEIVQSLIDYFGNVDLNSAEVEEDDFVEFLNASRYTGSVLKNPDGNILFLFTDARSPEAPGTGGAMLNYYLDLSPEDRSELL